MNTQILTKSFESKIEQFQSALGGVRFSIKQAGEILVSMLEENENTFEVLVGRRLASLPFLEALEKVGRGALDARLLEDTGSIAWRAISQCLPMRDQEQLLSGTIPVAMIDNGGIRIEHKRLEEITNNEATRVIGDGKIRTADEQIVIIKEQSARRAVRELRYEIFGNRIRFRHGAEFTFAELEILIERNAPKAEEIEESLKLNQITK